MSIVAMNLHIVSSVWPDGGSGDAVLAGYVGVEVPNKDRVVALVVP